ncbi:MAG: O-antigen ligase family protein, partial [Bacteroidales bacterium]|nr:O-antigen ligase family protein [Bacteroidales bacterium]
VLPAGYLFGTVAALTVAVAVHGLLQYSGLTLSANNFKMTGTFDNPAGFAAALACALPYVFGFFRNPRRAVVYVSVIIAFVILLAAVLSGSRAAIFASLVAIVCYAGSKYSGIKWKRWLKISLICIAVAGTTALYFLKKDSADGRLLIWQNTLNMVLDKPVAGHGYGAFNEKYMTYQAEYFEAHPDSKYSLLADNVLHPFNEYLLVVSEHGVVGLGILVLLGLFVVRSYLRKPDRTKFIALLSLLSLAVFSCFSYPFKYPFTWVIVFLNIAALCPAEKMFSSNIYSMAFRTGTAVFAAGLLFAGITLMKAEIRWNTVAKQSLAGKTAEMLPEYDRLYKELNKNGLFLYNHAAELHEVGEYERSLSVFERCIKHYNDYDVQMLIADNYNNLKQYDKAEYHLKRASAMCPVRFMPLYRLVELYRATNRMNEAIVLAQQILDKKVKIPSPTVSAIKNKMKQLINEQQ